MPGKAVGRAAAGLPWLCPNTDGLIRLAEAPAGLARASAADDAPLTLFLLRFVPDSVATAAGLFCPSALLAAVLPDTAAAHLQHASGCWADPTGEVATRCRAFARAAGAFAAAVAAHTRRAGAGRAAAVAALAPLGWLAVAAVDPAAALEPLHDHSAPADVQARVWGIDQHAIARRLAYRWRLPDWLATTLGNTGLSLAAARPIVTDVGLFAVAQLAALEAERRGHSLGLTAGASRAELLSELTLDDATIDALWSGAEGPAADPPGSGLDPNPHRVPLVGNLLRMAAESRRRNGAALVPRLEDRLDELHRAVAGASGDTDSRVREAKLAALAELAAGAGHEINNPLAVISGHAQRLLRTEPDPDRGAALQSVVRQTHRIAGIVRDLMQFARPPKPAPHRVCAAELLAAVRDELAPLSAERHVRLELAPVAAGAAVRGDRAQLQHALVAVGRNAVEAAGDGGWVRLGCKDGEGDSIAFVVEDGGPGLSAEALEHAFDPFYCGRPAGRGRGLGLPTAWRFLRQNGGDLRHEPADGCTRFVATVPRAVTLELLDRRSA